MLSKKQRLLSWKYSEDTEEATSQRTFEGAVKDSMQGQVIESFSETMAVISANEGDQSDQKMNVRSQDRSKHEEEPAETRDNSGVNQPHETKESQANAEFHNVLSASSREKNRVSQGQNRKDDTTEPLNAGGGASSKDGESGGDDDLFKGRKVVKVCPICAARTATKHWCNYGAVSCYGCRAFFRRCHQGPGGSPGFVPPPCERQGRCEVRAGDKRMCRRCRLDRCLEAGMKGELVLDEKGKKERFKGMRQKRENQRRKRHSDQQSPDSFYARGSLSPSASNHSSGLAGLMSSDSGSSATFSLPSIVEKHPFRVFGSHSRMPHTPYHQPKSFKESSTSSREPLAAEICDRVESTFKNIMYGKHFSSSYVDQSAHPYEAPSSSSSYETQLSQVEKSFKERMYNANLYTFMIDMTTTTDGVRQLTDLTLSSMNKLFLTLESQFRRFALEQSLFHDLGASDQTCLLTWNSQLFLQLVLARAFSAQSGFEQLCVLVGVQLSVHQASTMQTSMAMMTLEHFCAMTGTFLGNETRQTRYNLLLDQMGASKFGGPAMDLHLASHLLLFSSQVSMRLEEKDTVMGVFSSAIELFRGRYPDVSYDDIAVFVHVLNEMCLEFGMVDYGEAVAVDC